MYDQRMASFVDCAFGGKYRFYDLRTSEREQAVNVCVKEM